jgi:hypothetical protein
MTGIRIILIKFADKNQTRDEKYQNPTYDLSEYDGVKHPCSDAFKRRAQGTGRPPKGEY